MSEVIQSAHEILHMITEIVILLFEIFGLIVAIETLIKGVAGYLQRRPDTRLILGEGLSMALGFMLGGEILRTMIVQDLSAILIVAGIIVLHVALTLLLHWEKQNEKKEQEEKEHKKED